MTHVERIERPQGSLRRGEGLRLSAAHALAAVSPARLPSMAHIFGLFMQSRILAGFQRVSRTTPLAITALSLAACGGKAPPPQAGPPAVNVMTVEARPVPLEVDLPGRTNPYEVSEVRPQVSGIIHARLFKEGSNVQAGQVLYLIDPAPYRAAYDQALAQLANSKASLITARLKSERYADMVKINAVSHQDADDARAAGDEAAATVQQQAASVETARINLAYTKVTAPISGRVGTSSFTPGALVTNGQANVLTTIQKLDPIYVDVTQTADELLALKDDMARTSGKGGVTPSVAVRLKLGNGRDYPLAGRLQFTDVTVDQTTGSVTLRAIFPNPNAVLLPGMYVRARVVEGVDQSGILAPQQAVTRDEKGRATALVVDAKDRAQSRILTVAGAVGSQWRVTDGLNSGDRLIVLGGENAKPGAPVKVVASQPSQPTPAS